MDRLLTMVLEVVPQSTGTRGAYLIGAAVALLLLVYLVYSLFKPEKF
jgi:K+-transporting ATPase KdpF subunit